MKTDSCSRKRISTTLSLGAITILSGAGKLEIPVRMAGETRGTMISESAIRDKTETGSNKAQTLLKEFLVKEMEAVNLRIFQFIICSVSKVSVEVDILICFNNLSEKNKINS